MRVLIILAGWCTLLVSANTYADNIPPEGVTEARHVFLLADFDKSNNLTPGEFHQVFLDFDRDGDDKISSDEFLLDWNERNLGPIHESVVLFRHLDVDRDGFIQETDLPYIIYFFDRNLDNRISQAEFVVQWYKLSHTH